LISATPSLFPSPTLFQPSATRSCPPPRRRRRRSLDPVCSPAGRIPGSAATPASTGSTAAPPMPDGILSMLALSSRRSARSVDESDGDCSSSCRGRVGTLPSLRTSVRFHIDSTHSQENERRQQQHRSDEHVDCLGAPSAVQQGTGGGGGDDCAEPA